MLLLNLKSQFMAVESIPKDADVKASDGGLYPLWGYPIDIT